MKRALNNVKINACKNPTKISNISIINAKAMDTGATIRDLKIKINDNKLNIKMCPAEIFANKRIIKAKGLDITPMNSIGIIIGFKAIGTAGLNICPQYVLVAYTLVIIIVIKANKKVKAMLPVKFAPPGKKGINPKILFNQIKKKTVNKYGKNFACFFSPILGIAISSFTNRINGSNAAYIPFGTRLPFL